METCSRPVSSEPVCQGSQFPDGVGGRHQVGHSTPGLGHEHRSAECLFSHRHSPIQAAAPAFSLAGPGLQSRVVPFGLSPAPLIFTKVTIEFAAMVRAKGIRFRVYLDDWLNLAQSCLQCQSDLPFVLSLASELGFQINLS